MNFVILEEVDSTNSYVTRHAATLADMTMVLAESQTAGRGQRGNSWESEPGRNLTATLFWRPSGVAPRQQFAISEATALAVVDWLAFEGVEAKVKWPNDIYVADRKICGILIEHSLTASSIDHSRIGFGVNINQREFHSDAPNPVSLVQLTGEERDVSRAAASMGRYLEARLAQTATPEGRSSLHADFMAALWRGDGKPHPFRQRNPREGEPELFSGIIRDVSPEGPIRILDTDAGPTREFMFKEVEFIL
ncbi:MAG: biotin--[acetyl-CoA-carboxylase] ligase [Muribaculaceae bacterium]|nr:biotin--[acetyl-CoA-carboxylase] ligase [Muribaculaceae bacterium]